MITQGETQEISTSKETWKRRRTMLGFSFIDAQKPMNDFISESITRFGLLASHEEYPTGEYNADGNISTNFFDDLKGYAGNYEGLLSIWQIDNSVTKDGAFHWEKRIKPIQKLSDNQIDEIRKLLSECPEYEGTRPYENLARIAEFGRRGKEIPYYDGINPDGITLWSHVVMPPERLVAVCEIPTEKRQTFVEFSDRSLPLIMDNFNNHSNVFVLELTDLLEKNVDFQFFNQKIGWTLRDLATHILETTYFSILRQRGIDVWESGKVEHINHFLGIKPKDEVSKRYIQHVRAEFKKKFGYELPNKS